MPPTRSGKNAIIDNPQMDLSIAKIHFFFLLAPINLCLVENLRGVSFLGALPHRESDGLTEGRHAPLADRRRTDRTAKGKTKDQTFPARWIAAAIL